MGVHGNTVLVSATGVPGVITGSAYNPWDAVGSSWKMAEAAGSPGGVLYTVNLFNNAPSSNNPDLRLALFNAAFTPAADGAPFTITAADQYKFLGFVDISSAAWKTAGSSAMHAQVVVPGIATNAVNGDRHLYGQFQTTSAFRFGATANPLIVSVSTLLD